MRSFSAFIILFFIASISFAQIQFEKGYIITKDNKRVEGFIKNMNWKDNPTEISYKIKPSDKPIKADVTNIKEFALDHNFKYVSANVKVDLVNKPTVGTQNELDPVWTKANLFLKVILEGKATLYQYKIGKVERYFYSLSDSVINFLTYKQIHKASTLIKNNDFRQQLWDRLRLPKSTWEMMKTIDYNETELKEYFKVYNGSFPEPIVEAKGQPKKLYFNLKATPGVNFSSANLSVDEVGEEDPKLNFGSKAGLRFGLEAELIIPFNNYRWGILFEPTFQSYKSDAAFATKPTTISYNTIEFPIGLRYYIYVTDNSKVFFNAFYIPSSAINMDSKIQYYSISQADRPKITIETASNYALGAGYEFSKFSVEARYYTQKDILNNHNFESADYNRFSFILGYKFMKKRFK